MSAELLGTTDRCRLLAYSRAILEHALRGTDDASPEAPPVAALDERRGVFVTLRIDGALRGCIGRITVQRPLRDTLPIVTRDAALADRRFDPLTAAEVPRTTIEHSLLTEPHRVATPDAIELGRHGVILSAQGRRAVFLPEVAVEQAWDLPTTLRTLSRKAGLLPDAWTAADAQFEVFETIHYGETECTDGRPLGGA